MNEQRAERTFPLFVTLMVVAFLLMTFDIRAGGDGVLGSVRAATGGFMQPIESLASSVVDPLADFADGVSDIASLRAENDALRALLAERDAELATVDDQLARLETLERMLGLELAVEDFASVNANVTGRNDSFDLSFRIDKGTVDGVLPDQPVLDENGNLVGRVLDAWGGGATVMPITADVAAVTVTVAGQDGILESVPGANELQLNRDMTLDVFETARAVDEGDRVVTSQFSGAFPPGLPVGEVIEAVDPVGQSLTARVRPFFDLTSVRAVVVVVWPPDVAATGAATSPTTETTIEVPEAGAVEGDAEAGAG